jgi:ABC-type multidrug transport system fused ATPase/permease subunit
MRRFPLKLVRSCRLEDGSPEQLMRRDGLYAELFTLQAAAYLSPRE